jgi:hypothetical protein
MCIVIGFDIALHIALTAIRIVAAKQPPLTVLLGKIGPV